MLTGRSEVVGLEPESAGRLAGLLDDAGAALDAQSVRVQSLLDQAGVPCTAPGSIRSAARTCGESAFDLRRRAGLIRAPDPYGDRPGGIGLDVPGSICRPPADQRPVPGSTGWTDMGALSALLGSRTGPWVTPPANTRTGPWIMPGAQGREPGLHGGISNPTTVLAPGGGPRCDTAATDPGVARSKPRHYTEDDLGGASETLTDAEKEAVRLKQAGEPFVPREYNSAKRKLDKSEKVANTRNVGKERGGPNK